MSDEEFRRMEIRIFNPEGEVVYEVRGNLPRKNVHEFIEGVGYAFIPRDPIPRGFPVVATPLGKISCVMSRDCTDYPKKCPECAENRAKSYFIPKEVSESDIERAEEAIKILREATKVDIRE